MGVRAHEVGKHTGVSDDGVRLPISVVYAVLPRVHAQALRALSAVVERTGICALRHASKITRVLLLASESVGDGEDLQALADATAVCARRLGASTVEKLGVPLLNELVSRCKRSLDEKSNTAGTSNSVAKALAAQQNDAKNGGGKSKKRKRQAAAAATLAALNGGNAAAGQASFVSLRDESVVALTLEAVLTAIAGCVNVYGSLLPEETRSLTSEIALKAVQRRHVVGTGQVGAIDPVALALLSGAVTADASGSHAANLLHGLQYWQRRSIGSGGASSALQLVALNAGEAMLHPRAPPMAINFQQNPNKEQETYRFGNASRATSKESAVLGDAMDWDDNERDESDDEDAKPEQEDKPAEAKKKEAPAVTEEEEEEDDDDDEEEDYDDVRPQATAETSADAKKTETEENEDDDEEGNDEPAAKRVKDSDDEKEAPLTTVEADDDDDDDFPDIIVDDD
ncbi:Armadillo-type fold [Phytophthora cinnamomi]|nr:Armadillo-type fold [Phytophthora cinnamomi]